MISGVSGITHIALAVSIIILFVLWIKKINVTKEKNIASFKLYLSH